MCLYYDEKLTKKFRKQNTRYLFWFIPIGKKKIKAYKLYRKSYTNKALSSLYRCTTCLREHGNKCVIDDGYINKAVSYHFRKNCSKAGLYIDKPGVISSNRDYKELNEEIDRDSCCEDSHGNIKKWYLNKGSHVFLNKSCAEERMRNEKLFGVQGEMSLVEVECDLDDLVGVGEENDEAVFMKIKMTDEAFNKATT